MNAKSPGPFLAVDSSGLQPSDQTDQEGERSKAKRSGCSCSLLHFLKEKKKYSFVFDIFIYTGNDKLKS